MSITLSPVNKLINLNTPTLLSIISNKNLQSSVSNVANNLQNSQLYYNQMGKNIVLNNIIPNDNTIQSLQNQMLETNKKISNSSSSIGNFIDVSSNDTNDIMNNSSNNNSILYNNLDSFSIFGDNYGKL